MDFGPLFVTAGIAQAVHESAGFASELLESIRRYQTGDWGDLCPEDVQLNAEALRTAPGSWAHTPRSKAGRSGSSQRRQTTTAGDLLRPFFSLTSTEREVVP